MSGFAASSEYRFGERESDVWDSIVLRELDSGQEVVLAAHIGAIAGMEAHEWVIRLAQAGLFPDAAESAVMALQRSNALIELTVTGPGRNETFAIRIIDWLQETRPGVLALDTGQLYMEGQLVASV
jgi:hypothetical protein